MTRLSRDDVIKTVDRADNVTIAQIIGTDVAGQQPVRWRAAESCISLGVANSIYRVVRK